MPRTLPTLFPPTVHHLEAFGDRLRLARLRRRYSASAVAARADITRSTLHRAEKGDPGVSLGTYASILRVLGLEGDLSTLGQDDKLGRKLQDLNLPERRTAPRRIKSEVRDESP